MGLKNKKVLITREKNQAKVFAEKVKQLDGKALIADVLKIRCTGQEAIVDLPLPLSEYEWVFFTSANGVDCFLNALDEEDGKTTRLKFAVVGAKTAEALERHGKTATFIPSVYNAKTMAKEFLETYQNPGKMLLVRGSKARHELVEAFTISGCDFDLLEVYKTEVNQTAKEKLERKLQESPDYITFTSPSAVDAYKELALLPENETITVCIGTTTEKRAAEQGFRNLITPKTFTIDGMIHVICEHAKGGIY